MQDTIKIKKHHITLPVTNFDETFFKHNFKRHNQLFGGDCKRGLIVGCSGSGKTNVMMTLLLSPNGLRYLNVYICSLSLYQPKYEILRNIFSTLPEYGYYEFSDIENFPSPKDVKDYSVVLFDDIQLIGQNVVKDFFSYGRHKNLDCFLLHQSYTAIPKQLIRGNCNLLILFKQDLASIKNIYDNHISGDIHFDEFQKIANECWKQPHGFLVIDLDCEKSNGRYRMGFDKFLQV